MKGKTMHGTHIHKSKHADHRDVPKYRYPFTNKTRQNSTTTPDANNGPIYNDIWAHIKVAVP